MLIVALTACTHGDDNPAGPLECVFTWDEEQDFSGVYSTAGRNNNRAHFKKSSVLK